MNKTVHEHKALACSMHFQGFSLLSSIDGFVFSYYK